MEITYRAAGMTDEVTTCEHCGKAELKGTVRMLLLDVDGNTTEELYAGVVCAARLSGRKASAIRTEANRADRDRREAIWAARNAWELKHCLWEQPLREAAIGRWPRPAEIRAWRDTDEYQAAAAAFLAEHPEPARYAHA